MTSRVNGLSLKDLSWACEFMGGLMINEACADHIGGFSAFQAADIVLTVTLHGILTKHHISHSNPSPPTETEEPRPQQSNGFSISTLWQTHTTKIVKVNALRVMRDLIVVGGVGLGGNGFVEIWDGDEYLRTLADSI